MLPPCFLSTFINPSILLLLLAVIIIVVRAVYKTTVCVCLVRLSDLIYLFFAGILLLFFFDLLFIILSRLSYSSHSASFAFVLHFPCVCDECALVYCMYKCVCECLFMKFLLRSFGFR